MKTRYFDQRFSPCEPYFIEILENVMLTQATNKNHIYEATSFPKLTENNIHSFNLLHAITVW